MKIASPPFGLLATAALSIMSITASAVPITITAQNQNQNIDNVLFNDSSLLHSGSLVQGNFSGTGAGFIIDFTSASGNNQIAGSGGQATIEGLSGNDPFTSLTFGLESGATFTRAVLNPDPIGDGTILFSVSYLDASGSPFLQSFSLSGSGQNFFTIDASEGARITQITFSSANTSFADASQFRLGGFARSTNVPDGGVTVTLLGLALCGLGIFRRNLS